MTDAEKKPITIEDATKPVTAEPDDGVRAWQDKKVRAGINAANEGRFASNADLRRVIRKYVPQEGKIYLITSGRKLT